RQVDDRRLGEPLVSFPPRWLRECEVDLHLRAPVAEGRRRLAFEQPSVELRRRHVGDHGFSGGHGLAVDKPDTGRFAASYENALNIAAGLAGAAVIAD